MGGARLLGLGLATAAVLLVAGPPTSRAAEPPNPNDPCISGTRNVCGTTGVGFYKTYRYGTRWFGDFRSVVPGQFHMYCIDLRFWYPGPDYDYRPVPAAGLRNRDNQPIPVVNLQKMAYVLWTYGRTTSDDAAAAVMLYVHSLMGDARPGEIDPTAIGPAVSVVYTRIAREAALYHGPYRVDVALPAQIGAGKKATATIRVLSGAGVPLPNLDLSLTATGASNVPSTVRTNTAGVATVEVTATGAGGVHLTATTEPVPSTLPLIYRPSKPQAARNGQRLAAGDSQRVSNTDTSGGLKAQVSMTTAAAPTEVVSGGRSTDKVTLTGALASYRQNVNVRLFGPFRTVASIDCATKPVFTSTFQANGPGSYTTPAATLTQPGYYQYQESAPGDANHIGFTTPCNAPTERVRVQAQPAVHTVVSAKSLAANGSVSDTVTVSGLWGEQVTVQAALYGPFPARNAIACSGAPVWTGTIQVTADGTYQTEAHALTTPGYYTYYETIAAGEFVRAVKTPCADTAETSIVLGQPALQTQVSSQRTKPGGTITDKVVVSGIGKLALPVQVALYGPFATRGAIACSGTPYWRGAFVARGDGTYTTAAVRIDRAGYYTYREAIVASEASPAAATPCAQTAETTFAHAQPAVTTITSNEVVRPGGTIFDRVRVTGLGKTAARIRVELFGPFATRAAIGCTTRLHGSTVVTAQGNGVLRTPRFQLAKTGFYTFRERLIGSPLVSEFTTPCAVVAETSLSRPEIVTGRGDVARYVQVRAPVSAPTRVRIASLGIDAPVSAVGIDIARGVLGVPPSIHRTGWWKDGAAAGARSGSILIAGHVDSATGGVGSFFRLKEARAGARVTVTNAAGRTFSYRVVTVRDYAKQDLPTSSYSLRGRPRLVLVTCGGPFIASEGHYRDNVVLVAVPV
jgi:Sortase domain